MNGEVYRIEIPVEVQDRTDPGLRRAQTGVNALEQGVSRFERTSERAQRRLERMNRTRVRTILEAVDRVSPVISRIGGAARSLARSPFRITLKAVDMATAPMRSIFRFATSLRGIMTGLVAGVAANKLVAGPVALADALTSAEIGFETMLKSADKAKAMIADIKEFAIKTPFETMDIIDQTQRMMAMGWQAKDVLKDMELIGNAAAATGKGSEGMQRIVLALGQIKMKGKVSAEEINQLAEAGVRAREYIAKGLGVTVPKAIAMMEDGLVDANKAVTMILNGMGEFNGMMDKTASRTVGGLFSQIKDLLTVSFTEKWGSGLQKGAISGFAKLNGWLTKNRTSLTKFGEALGEIGSQLSFGIVNQFTNLATRAASAFDELERAEQAQGAMSDLGEKMSLIAKAKFLWNKIIVEPFDEWWMGGGKAATMKKSEEIGRTLGGGIGGFLAGALGLAADMPKGLEGSPFMEAGMTAGKSFFDAFWDAFDAEKLAQKAADAFKGLAGDAGKTLPGGDKATGSSWISTAILAAIGMKGGKGALKLLKGGKGAMNLFRGARGATTAATTAATVAETGTGVARAAEGASTVARTRAGSGIVDSVKGFFGRLRPQRAPNINSTLSTPAGADFWQNANLNAVNRRSDIVGMANSGRLSRFNELTSAFGSPRTSLLGRGASALTRGSKLLKGVPVLGALGAGASIAMAEDKKRETVAQVSGGLGGWGGAAAGGAAGAALGSVVPILGTAIGGAIGAAIGGLGGYFGGDALGRGVYDSVTKPGVKTNNQYGHGMPYNPVTTYPQGKNPNMVQTPQQTITVSVNANPQFTIQATTSADEVMKVIRGNMGALTDEIADQISKGLVKTFGNMPMKAV